MNSKDILKIVGLIVVWGLMIVSPIILDGCENEQNENEPIIEESDTKNKTQSYKNEDFGYILEYPISFVSLEDTKQRIALQSISFSPTDIELGSFITVNVFDVDLETFLDSFIASQGIIKKEEFRGNNIQWIFLEVIDKNNHYVNNIMWITESNGKVFQVVTFNTNEAYSAANNIIKSFTFLEN